MRCQLGEDLVQMPFDSAWAEVEPSADLRVRQPLSRELRNVTLLPSQVVASLSPSRPDLVSDGHELNAGPLGESVHADIDEQSVRNPELCPRVFPSLLPS